MKKDYNFNSDSFKFAENVKIHDLKLETKPLSYFQDAWIRFRKNKASVVAAIIIGILLLFSLLAPLFTPYTVSYNDTYFRYVLPKSKICYNLGLDFWDGCKDKEVTKELFYYYYSMGVETGHNAIKDQEYETEVVVDGTKKTTYYTFRLDTYQAAGMAFMNVTAEEYASIQAYQDETGIQVIYPITTKSKRPEANQDNADANFWYETVMSNGKTMASLDEDGNYVNIYRTYTNGYDNYTSTVRMEGEGVYLYDYSLPNQTGYQIRVNYYEYYIYNHTYVLQDGITEPVFIFGSSSYGQDIFTCLANGGRFSFMLAIIVASVNLFVGAIYGAIEGYYGGAIDLAMERFSDIIAAVPFMIVITLLKYHLGPSSNIWALLISFFITGWVGMAARVRMQFYRFKNQEYILAARTLGASDGRLMFKHIFPNAIGTIITGSILIIPGVIFSESSLSYLGIINLSAGNITSIGTMLAAAQPYMTSFPHMLFFPAIFISLLMLSFNLFGNGLRDAFNPSLRGSEE